VPVDVPRGDPPRLSVVTLAALGFVAGGSLGTFGSIPILVGLNTFFGVHIDGLMPLSLGILGAGIGTLFTPVVYLRQNNE
jgi:hypothetical protein